MSSTNKTTNYELSQFIGSDKPAWLVDYNGDMSKIDAQMKVNADAASSAASQASSASSAASSAADGVSALNTQINGASGLAADVVTAQGNINTINSLIGSGEPTTTNKTLIGAINELDAKDGALSDLTTTTKTSLVAAINEVASGQGGTITAAGVTYDNTTSGLTATDVQSAIDELASGSSAASSFGTAVDVSSYDGGTTYTAPSDGFVAFTSTNSTLKLNGEFMASATGGAYACSFVRKGMTIGFNTSPTSGNFYPLV